MSQLVQPLLTAPETQFILTSGAVSVRFARSVSDRVPLWTLVSSYSRRCVGWWFNCPLAGRIYWELMRIGGEMNWINVGTMELQVQGYEKDTKIGMNVGFV